MNVIWPADHPWETIPGVTVEGPRGIREVRIDFNSSAPPWLLTARGLVHVRARLPSRIPQVIVGYGPNEETWVPHWVQFCLAWESIESSLAVLTDDQCRAMGVAYELGGREALRSLWYDYPIIQARAKIR